MISITIFCVNQAMYCFNHGGRGKKMDLMMIADKSSNVYCNWTEFIDTVIHQSPKFVQNDGQDVFMVINFEYLNVLLESVRYVVEIDYDQEENEYIATMDGFWFVEAGKTKNEAIHKLAEQLVDYAQDYFKELDRHFRSEEHTSELQSRGHLVCRLLLEKKKMI